MSDFRMRSSFQGGNSNLGRTPSPSTSQLEQQQRPGSSTMSGNPLRYSHDKMGVPNESIMRIPQQAQPADTARPINLGGGGQMPGLGSLRPSSEMLNVGQQNTPECMLAPRIGYG